MGLLSEVEANVVLCFGETEVVGNIVGEEWNVCVCFSLVTVRVKGGELVGEEAPFEGDIGDGRRPRCRGLAYFTVLLAITVGYLALCLGTQHGNIQTGIEIRSVLGTQSSFRIFRSITFLGGKCCRGWCSRIPVLRR